MRARAGYCVRRRSNLLFQDPRFQLRDEHLSTVFPEFQSDQCCTRDAERWHPSRFPLYVVMYPPKQETVPFRVSFVLCGWVLGKKNHTE